MCWRFAELALGEINDQHLSAIHDGADVDRASDLAQYVADGRRCQQRANLVLNRRDRFDRVALAVVRKFVQPEIPHHWIARMSQKGIAISPIGKQAG